MSRPIDIVLTPLSESPRNVARPRPVMPEACASGGCGGSPNSARPPAPSFAPVLVNGVEIPAQAIAHEMQHHPAGDVETSWRAAARALALRELLLQEAHRTGVDSTSCPEVDGERETEDEVLIRRLLDAQLLPVIPDEATCLRVYKTSPERFRAPDLFEASHILIEPDGAGEDAWGRAEERARQIASDVGDDRISFANAARDFSSCPSGRQDGALGQLRRGDLVPSVQQALEALEPGTAGRVPVRSRFGWHVLRLERRIQGQLLPFDAVHVRIRDMLEARAWTTASVAFLASLVREARIEGVDLAPGIAKQDKLR